MALNQPTNVRLSQLSLSREASVKSIAAKLIKRYSNSKPSLTGSLCESSESEREAVLLCLTKTSIENESITRNTVNEILSGSLLKTRNIVKSTLKVSWSQGESDIKRTAQLSLQDNVLQDTMNPQNKNNIDSPNVENIVSGIVRKYDFARKNTGINIITPRNGIGVSDLTTNVTPKSTLLEFNDAEHRRRDFLIHSPLNSGRPSNELTSIAVLIADANQKFLPKSMLSQSQKAEGLRQTTSFRPASPAIVERGIGNLTKSHQLDFLSDSPKCGTCPIKG